MGMFDTILVHESIIDKLIQDIEDLKEHWKPFKNYYNFQTKDLDNSLSTYNIDENYRLSVMSCRYDEDTSSPAGVKIVEEKVEFCENKTAYIEFYDIIPEAGKFQIFITFSGHIVQGKLIEVTLKSIEREDLELREISMKRHRERWKNIEKLWSFRLFRAIDRFEWKLHRFFRPLTSRYEKLKKALRDHAENKYPFEP
jgi:hypothetical protein